MTRPNDIYNDPSAPFSQEAEEAVLGAVLLNPPAFIAIRAFLKPGDFFLLRHQYIWEALQRLSNRGEPIDHITLAEELENLETLDQIGGRAYLIQLMNNTGTAMYAEVYGRLVERTAIRRKLMQAADDIRDLARNEELNIANVINEAESKLFTVGESQIQREFVPMWDALSDYYDRIEYLLQHKDESVGLPSGFRDLDQLLGGFQKSDLLVFAGRPGMGKCVDKDTLIHTDRGTVPIHTLKPDNVPGQPDDEGGIYYPLCINVLTPDGIQQTSHFYDAGRKLTLTLTTRAGYSLTGTYPHPVRMLNKQGEKVWVPLADVQPGQSVAVRDDSQPEPVPAIESAAIASGTDSSAVTSLVTADALLPDSYTWDTVESIDESGVRHCCDLVVPESHSYIANGIVSHNTSWMLTAAMNTARLGARVAIFTMEMGVQQMVQRFMAMETGINVQKLRLGDLNNQEAARFTEAVGRISNFKIFIDDTPAMSPLEMRTKCRRLKHEHGLDLLFIDYMQLMNAGGHYENNRVQEISYISRALKELARELDVPVISAAQLSRAVEQRQDKRPVLSDLRESGSIEQDSDIVMFLYRDEVYNEATEFPNQADIIVAKHRNGPTGTISLYFEKSLTKFMDASVHRVDLSDLE